MRGEPTWNLGCCFLSACTKCSISASVNSRTLSSPARGAISFLNTGPICAQANGIFTRTVDSGRTDTHKERRQTTSSARLEPFQRQS